MKAAITIMLEQNPPQPGENLTITRADRVAKLLKKIEYAGDCIELNHNKKQAIEFLQKVHLELSTMHRMLPEIQPLIEKCYQLIRDYGTIAPSPKNEEE